MANEPTTDRPAGPAYLIHSYEHRAYPLPANRPFTIGRDGECDIMVNEVFVSRHHAELQPDGTGGYTLQTVGSARTLVNDASPEGPHPLREGDTVTVGTMKFVFTCQRLPVAMAIAEPGTRTSGGVDERRPTLTFPIAGGREQGGKQSMIWVVLGVVIVVVALLLYYAS